MASDDISPDRMTILNRYIRPPDDIREMTDELLHDDGDVVVGKFIFDITEPQEVDGRIIFDSGFPCIYFVFFDGAGHDILKVYHPDGSLWGYYCDIVTDVRRIPGGFEIRDLFLDVWIEPDCRTFTVLDEDEFRDAVKNCVLSQGEERTALRNLRELITDIRCGRFPPPITTGFRM